ncbi:cation:dicarboxylase symporter family transporter [Helicobacter sp. faydin-H20]|uniref:cation:dicarboxylate symporter family transporter n=1 Tax=Helicobacter anatolicus TaxID=2905874 RepID=UPI001E510A5D|nr:cation:dicarboxylase symporter family transporter [Helicobacter anatolicus]MCE3037548.1 cation:dicarboxylase symporter family transporter [Helicobacter anatolicus]
MENSPPLYKKLFTSLAFWVIIGLILGICLGAISPHHASNFKPYTIDPFIKSLKLLVGPIIFLTIITGIIGLESLKTLGSIGIKSFLYFEFFSTIALVIGVCFGEIFTPGSGLHFAIDTLDSSLVDKYTHVDTENISSVSHILLSAIPKDPITPFLHAQTLQVLFMAIVIAILLLFAPKNWRIKVIDFLNILQKFFFKILILLMYFSPIATFGAMAFLIGKFGFESIYNMLFLLFVMLLACGFFIFGVLGILCYFAKVNIFKFLRLIGQEILMVFATSSSESVLAPLMKKLEISGINRAVTGLVIPTGYSFNLDCTNIYMALSVIFLAQAFDIPLSLEHYIEIVVILMITSKGAVGVTGSGFIVLAGTLQALGTGAGIPAACVVVLLGVDKFMSEIRACGNLCGNAVACLIVAIWDKKINKKEFYRALENPKEYQVL